MRIGCVVMASGASRRFGRNKLLEPLAGRPLIAHMLGQLPREDLEKVVVVSPFPPVGQLAEGMGFLHLPPVGPSQADTIRTGILQMDELDGCLFCVGDQPLCTRGSMQRMLDAFSRRPEGIVRLYSDVIPGNPVLFPKSCFSQLAQLPTGESGKWVLQQHLDLLVPVQATHPWELDDVDTPESLAKMEARLREAGR